MDRLTLDGDAAELQAAIVAHRFVVIARDINKVGTLADLAQQLLQDIVVGLRPIDATLDMPEIDNVADQVNAEGVMVAQEI